MKVLIFTTSYNRPVFLRQCILSVKNQTYSNYVHSVNISVDRDALTKNYEIMFDDLTDEKLIFGYNINTYQYINHLNAIKQIKNYENYDIFVKMDDDDIYKSKYIENIVNFFETNEVDIVSSKINYQLNGYDLYKGSFDNLGANPKNSTYHMPPTFAFNKKGLEAIISPDSESIKGFEDMTWRILWENAHLRHQRVMNDDQIIWHIHGKNISTSDFLKKK